MDDTRDIPRDTDPHPSMVRLVLYTLELAKRHDVSLEKVLQHSKNEVLVQLLDAVIASLPESDSRFVREAIQRQMELKAMSPEQRREMFRVIRKPDGE